MNKRFILSKSGVLEKGEWFMFISKKKPPIPTQLVTLKSVLQMIICLRSMQMYLCDNFLFSTDFRKPYCALDYWLLQEKSSKLILLDQLSAFVFIYCMYLFIHYTALE